MGRRREESFLLLGRNRGQGRFELERRWGRQQKALTGRSNKAKAKGVMSQAQEGERNRRQRKGREGTVRPRQAAEGLWWGMHAGEGENTEPGTAGSCVSCPACCQLPVLGMPVNRHGREGGEGGEGEGGRGKGSKSSAVLKR